jgi:hypothetical protein
MTHGVLINFHATEPHITLTSEVERVERAGDGTVSVCAQGQTYPFGMPGLEMTSIPEYDDDPDVTRFDVAAELLAAAQRAGVPVVDV